MMIEPSLKDMLVKAESKYSLVSAVAKRARQIVEGQDNLSTSKSKKPVTIAVWEVYEDQVVIGEKADALLIEQAKTRKTNEELAAKMEEMKKAEELEKRLLEEQMEDEDEVDDEDYEDDEDIDDIDEDNLEDEDEDNA